MDPIDKQAAIDALEKAMCEDGFRSETGLIHKTTAYEIIRHLPSAQPEIIRCRDCKNSEHWYGDRRRCFLWAEDGVSVFDDGFCNYAERRTDEQ